jgi:Ca2+-binding RTX toxin-like protein
VPQIARIAARLATRTTSCIVGTSSINTIAAQGGSSIVIGGPQTDIIQAANGNNFVVPGAGVDVVSTGVGNDTVAIYDLCELQPGDTVDMGTGFNTLIAPLPLAQLKARGLNITNVSQVLVQQNSCKSACVTQPDCSGNGSCAEGAQTGQVMCKCLPGFSGTKCEIAPVAATELNPPLAGAPTACFAPSFTGTLQATSSGQVYSSIQYATPDASTGVCAPQFCDANGNVVPPPEGQAE